MTKFNSSRTKTSSRASQKLSFSRTILVSVASMAALALGACAVTPEQLKTQKSEQLTKFCTEVAKHLLDRDPKTIQASVNELLHGELSDGARTKLQAQKIIPDSSIDVLKAISDAEVSKRVNEIEVSSVKPLTSLDKDDVQLQVTGKETVKAGGKVVMVRPFSMTMTCRLTKDMDGFAQLLDLKGFPTANTIQTPVEADNKPRRGRKRG